MLRRFGLTLLALLGFVSPAAAQMQMAVANACPPATLTAAADGPWTSAGTWSGNRVPTASDSVKVGGGHTVTGQLSDFGCATIGSDTDPNDWGKVDFAGTFTFTTIQVERYGDFSTTQPFEAIVRDSPIDTALDPEQNGHGIIIDSGRAYWIAPTRSTWVEHTDIAAGDTVLHLRQPPVNWQPGEKVIVFDTRRGNNCSGGGCTKGAQREVKIIAAVAGSDVTVTTPFQFDHTSVGSPLPSADGTVKRFYPWATHLGGRSIVRSQNPAGVRGHVIAIHTSDVWFENVTFDELGRTTMAATTTGGGANQIGRYPVHMHHNVGRGPQANGRAFTLHGLEVNGSPRYCVVIHKSSWGLIEDSAVYNCPAAGFYYEDGDEFENITQRNSAVFGVGQGDREGITSGFGFYYHGPWNHTLNNRSANHFNQAQTEAAYGFKYFPKYLGTVLVSPGPGQMPSLSRNSYTQGPITQFEGNYCFADESCFTFWWINTMPFYQEGTTRSLIKDLTFVRIPEKGVFQYEGVRMTFDGLIGRDVYRGWAGQDYIFKYGEIRNVDLQTCDTGMELSPLTVGTELLIENSQFACTMRNLAPMLSWTSAPTAYDGVNATTVRRFRNIKTLVGKAYTLYLANGQRNYSSTQTTFVEAHQGNPSDNFQWFAPGSAPSDLLPQHAPVGCTPGTSCSRVGSPAAGLTNQQNQAQYGLWFMGPPLCANPLTSSSFDGFACGTIASPPPACTYAVTPTTAHASPAGGDSFPITITASAGTGCPVWAATASQPWVTLSQAGGTGTASLTATVAANAGASRTANLTIDGQSLAVTQAAAAVVPVDCVVSAWTAWGTCNATTLTQTRTRTIVTQPSNGGAVCPALTETQACTVTPPPPSGTFVTYLGGAGFELPRDVAVDTSGNVYVAGGTESVSFPTTAGAYQRTFSGRMDVFVTKYSPTGQILWSTLLGGPNYDRAYAIELGSDGSVYLGGRAGPGFPTTAGVVQPTFPGTAPGLAFYGQQSGFVAKLSATGGQLLFSSYVGAADARTIVRDLTVDAQGRLYCALIETTGLPAILRTANAFQPTVGGGLDTAVVVLGAGAQAVLYGSYLGGSGDEGSATVAADGQGGFAAVTYTPSSTLSSLRPFGGATDYYVVRVSPTYQVQWRTYYGGSGTEESDCHLAAFAANGDLVLGGGSTSATLPGSSGGLVPTNPGSGTNDPFIARLSPAGVPVVATFVGGSANDGGEGIAVGPTGEIGISGAANSPAYPVTAGAYQKTSGGGQEGHLDLFSADLKTRLYSTLLGGPGVDSLRAVAVGTGVIVGVGPMDAGVVTTNGIGTAGGGDAIVAVVAVGGTAPPPPPAPVDCVVSAWTAWGTCDPNTSTQTRTRTIVTPPANGGAACPVVTETQPCTITPPPPPPPATITITTRDSRYAAVKPICSAGCVRADFTRTLTVGGAVTTFTDTTLDTNGEYVWLFTEPVDASGLPLGYSLFAVVFDAQGGSQRQDLVGR